MRLGLPDCESINSRNSDISAMRSKLYTLIVVLAGLSAIAYVMPTIHMKEYLALIGFTIFMFPIFVYIPKYAVLIILVGFSVVNFPAKDTFLITIGSAIILGVLAYRRRIQSIWETYLLSHRDEKEQDFVEAAKEFSRKFHRFDGAVDVASIVAILLIALGVGLGFNEFSYGVGLRQIYSELHPFLGFSP